VAEALAWLEARTGRLPAEQVPLHAAMGRVLADDVEAPKLGRMVAMDGHAVRAADTLGASEYAPLPVRGMPVVAGAALPDGFDAILPPHLLEAGAALGTVAPGHGVALSGGTVPAGTRLRPAHLAALANRAQVPVVLRPRVALAVAGPKAGPEALLPMLQALVEAEGGVVADPPDLRIHAGRSGPGPDDDGVGAFATVFAHGILLQPGETSALGTVGGITALLLPGDPIVCATAFAVLAAPALRRLAGRPEPAPRPARLARKIVSGLGAVDAVRVRLVEGRAVPIPAGAAAAAAAEADGLVLVPEGSEGYPEGATIPVHPVP